MKIEVMNMGRKWEIEASEDFWYHYLTILSDSVALDRQNNRIYAAQAKDDEWYHISKQLVDKSEREGNNKHES